MIREGVTINGAEYDLVPRYQASTVTKLRRALIQIARSKHPPTSTRALTLRDIARAALIGMDWDWKEIKAADKETAPAA